MLCGQLLTVVHSTVAKMEQSFNEEAVKTEPMDLDYCQNDVSLDEPTAFVYGSQFALEPEIRNGEIEHAPENDNQVY